MNLINETTSNIFEYLLNLWLHIDYVWFENGNFEEGSTPLSQVVSLRDKFRVFVVKVYAADVENLEERLETLVMEHESLEEYNEPKSIYSLANIYLHSQTVFNSRQVEMLYA